jgi:hypothetical protein
LAHVGALSSATHAIGASLSDRVRSSITPRNCANAFASKRASFAGGTCASTTAHSCTSRGSPRGLGVSG